MSTEIPRFTEADAICLQFGAKLSELKERKASTSHNQKRFQVWNHMRRNGWTHDDIAAVFATDRTSVVHGVEKHRQMHDERGIIVPVVIIVTLISTLLGIAVVEAYDAAKQGLSKPRKQVVEIEMEDIKQCP